MDEKGWVYELPKGADGSHAPPPSLSMDVTGVEGKRETKIGRVGTGTLNSKPFAKEIMEASGSYISQVQTDGPAGCVRNESCRRAGGFESVLLPLTTVVACQSIVHVICMKEE